jgi:hypothetical protein
MQMDAVCENFQIDKVSRLDLSFQAHGRPLQRNIHFSVTAALHSPSNSLFPFFDLPRFFFESEKIFASVTKESKAGLQLALLTTIIVGRLWGQVLGRGDWWRLAGRVVVVRTRRGASRSFSISASLPRLAHHHLLFIFIHFLSTQGTSCN